MNTVEEENLSDNGDKENCSDEIEKISNESECSTVSKLNKQLSNLDRFMYHTINKI